MAEGNRHLRLQGGARTAIEAARPAPSTPSTSSSSARRPTASGPRRPRPRRACAPCARCGAPTTGEVCAFCRLVERAARRRAGARRAGALGTRPEPWPRRRTRGAEPGHRVSRPFADGDQVLLIDAKKRRYLVTLTAGGEFHTHAGRGRPRRPHRRGRGRRRSARAGGRPCSPSGPTLAEFVLKMPRGAQVIYPKDLGPILMLADIFPGARVLESGVGSGALSMTLVRAGAVVPATSCARTSPTGPRKNVATFLGDDALERYTVEQPRRLRGHRRGRPRPGRARPARAVAGREARGPALHRGGDARGLHAPDHAGGAAARRAVGARASAWSTRSRCSTAAGTSRASRSGPTTAWSPTPGSSPARGC